jgi:hypothetical protein
MFLGQVITSPSNRKVPTYELIQAVRLKRKPFKMEISG